MFFLFFFLWVISVRTDGVHIRRLSRVTCSVAQTVYTCTLLYFFVKPNVQIIYALKKSSTSKQSSKPNKGLGLQVDNMKKCT